MMRWELFSVRLTVSNRSSTSDSACCSALRVCSGSVCDAASAVKKWSFQCSNSFLPNERHPFSKKSLSLLVHVQKCQRLYFGAILDSPAWYCSMLHKGLSSSFNGTMHVKPCIADVIELSWCQWLLLVNCRRCLFEQGQALLQAILLQLLCPTQTVTLSKKGQNSRLQAMVIPSLAKCKVLRKSELAIKLLFEIIDLL